LEEKKVCKKILYDCRMMGSKSSKVTRRWSNRSKVLLYHTEYLFSVKLQG